MFASLARLPAARSFAGVSFARTAAAFSTAASAPKVAVVGASGGIGQPLSLLLKTSEAVGDLSLFDIVGTPGVAADLGHICTNGKVEGFVGSDQMAESLVGCKAVVIPAGVPRKPGMTRDDLFNTNASIVQGIAEACAKSCPEAFFLIISNPVNSTVPIFAETLKKAGVYDEKKLMGVTTLDITRANTFCADALGKDVKDMNVTVLGGHAGTTILPLLSSIPGQNFTDQQIADLTHRIQFGGDEVVQAKDGAGSATLSMAYAAAVFTERLLAAAAGEKNVVECTYVQSPLAVKDGAEFFSSPCVLGPNGVEEILPLPALNAVEQANYDAMIGDLSAQIEKGKAFANK